VPMVFFFFGGQFCDVAKVEDLAEYWLQAKYESKLFKHPSIFLATYLYIPCRKKSGNFS